jgi:hypothetical protein
MVISYNQNMYFKIKGKKLEIKLHFISLYFLYSKEFTQ